MPLIQDDGSLAKEVHFKTGSGGSGQVDLSGYVRRPGTALRDGRWLAYRETENGASKEWSPITTDMVETNGQLMFRDINGRFAPTPEELGELTNQLKVNRFIWEKIQELDLKDDGFSAGKYLDRVPQFRSRFEMVNDVPQIPADADEGDLDNTVDWYERSFHLKGGIWWLGDDGYADEQTYDAKYVTHLMMRKGSWKDASDGNEVTHAEFFPIEGKVGDIITVQSTRIELRENHTYNGDSLSRGIYDRWRITEKLAVEGNPYNGWTCFAVEKIEREELYQARKWTSVEPGLQMAVAVSVDIQEASAVGSSEGIELPKEKTMQLRGEFKLTADKSKAIIPDDAYDENGDILAGVWYLNPWVGNYNGGEITHVMLGSGAWVTAEIDGEDASYVPYSLPNFVPGDYITLDIYKSEHIDKPGKDEYKNDLKHHVFLVEEIVPIQIAQGVANMQALKVSRAGRSGFYGGRLYPEQVYIPCTVTPGYIEDPAAIERIEDLEDAVNGKDESAIETGGRLKAVGARWDINSNVDAAGKTAKFHLDGEDAVVFNHDIIPSGRIDWANSLSPFPNTLLLKFDDGQEYWFSVEHIGNAGTNSRGKNFKIVDRGTLPEDVSVFMDLEFDIYERYEPATDSLQDQIDALQGHGGGEYVSKVGGDEMEGPLKIKNNPDVADSRDARKLEVLNIYSGSENSSLNLGAKNTSIYVGANQTTFIKPIHVDDIKEKNDGAGITIHDTLKFGSEQGVLMEIDPKTGEEQKIKLFEGPGDKDKTLNVSLHGATYQNAIEFESGPSAQREPILRIDSNKGLKAKNLSAWDTRVRDVAAPEDEQDATNKTYVDEIGTRLQAEIDQLALGLEALIVQREAGKWTYKGALADGIPSSAGEFSLGSDDLTASTNVIILNQTDLTGKFHGFGDVDVGDYVEIVDLDKPDEYALFVVDSEADGDGIVQFNLKLKDKGNNFLVGTTCEIRFFALTEQDLNLTDLDTRYAQKSHNHDARDITSGTISMARLPTGTSSTSVAVGNHSHSGVYAPADHTHSGLGGSVLVKHGYPCRIDYDHQHSGSDKHMIKYRSWGNGYAYEAQGSSKICETGEVKIVYNSSGWENKIGKRGLLVASTSNSNPWVYPYLVMNIFDANQYVQYGMVNYEFKGTVSWCRSTGATWSSDPELYWTWIGDGK